MMVARECYFCHEDHCISDNDCKWMIKSDESVIVECSAENSDLIDCPEGLEHLFIP